MTVKYVHTNIVAEDWEKLAEFYINTFDCERVGLERDLKGEWVNRLTNIEGAHIKGLHLKLPGYQDGPTLEIFQYNQEIDQEWPEVNRPGLAHLAFLVDDVKFYLQLLINNGGSKLGEIEEYNFKGIGLLTVVYARDLEGNIVEIQNWR